MMDDKFPTPNNTPPMQELSDTLRPAVERVRAAAPPSEPVQRSMDRAQRLGPPPRRRSRRWLPYSTAAGIAAVILVGFRIWPDQARDSAEQVALQHKASERRSLQGFMSNFDLMDPHPAEKKKETSDAVTFKDARSKDHNVRFDPVDGQPLSQLDDQANAMEGANEENAKPGLPPPAPALRVRGASTVSTMNLLPAPTYIPPLGTGPPARPRGIGSPGGIAGVGGGGFNQPGQVLGGSQGPDNMGMGGMGMMGMYGGMASQQGSLNNSRETDLKNAKALSEDLKTQIRKQELVLNRARFGQSSNADLAKKQLKEAREQLKSVETRITELQSQAGGKPGEKQPQVWHRDRGQPTFARVYVGDGNSLELVSLHVSVTIEGPRARTVVDHIFRNPHNRQLEGTFEYPLPSGASPSYFAMFLGQTRDTVPALFGRRGDNASLPAAALAQLTPAELVKHVDTGDWGRLQEGRIVSKQKALETYEEVVRGRIDPALLEYSGGNTFSGRVFPIPAKGYNRVILAYEELLPFAQEQMIYRFPLPNCKLSELQFRLQAQAAECLQPVFLPKNAKKEEHGGRITFARTWKDSKPEGEAVFACTPAHTDAQAVSGQQGDNGPRYVYARLRP
ncbi:MAG TPA: VIT domain-containing protein, partial [Gemmataceae bacterium]|nr:VIT domain-containing protein [Gemmataceae bacterium]